MSGIAAIAFAKTSPNPPSAMIHLPFFVDDSYRHIAAKITMASRAADLNSTPTPPQTVPAIPAHRLQAIPRSTAPASSRSAELPA